MCLRVCAGICMTEYIFNWQPSVRILCVRVLHCIIVYQTEANNSHCERMYINVETSLLNTAALSQTATNKLCSGISEDDLASCSLLSCTYDGRCSLIHSRFAFVIIKAGWRLRVTSYSTALHCIITVLQCNLFPFKISARYQ